MYSLEIFILSVVIAAFLFYKVKQYRIRYVQLEAQRLMFNYDVKSIDYEVLNQDYKASKYRKAHGLHAVRRYCFDEICDLFKNTYRTKPVTASEVEGRFANFHQSMLDNQPGYGPMQLRIMVTNSEFVSDNLDRIIQACNSSMGLEEEESNALEVLDPLPMTWRECLGLSGENVSLEDVEVAYRGLSLRKTSEPRDVYHIRLSRLGIALAQARAAVS